MDKHEWGVVRADDKPSDLHRGPMACNEAFDWVKEWREMHPDKPAVADMFVVVRRKVGPWEVAP